MNIELMSQNNAKFSIFYLMATHVIYILYLVISKNKRIKISQKQTKFYRYETQLEHTKGMSHIKKFYRIPTL
jgi:hypothetical protein